MPDNAPPGRRERRRVAALGHAARAAARPFMTHGDEATTMEQIAAAADLAKGTLYHHASSKEAVLANWMHRTPAEDAPRLRASLERPRSFEGKLRRLFAESARWMQAHRAWLLSYFRHRCLHIGSGVGAARAHVPRDPAAVFTWLIAQAPHDGTPRTGPAAEHLAALRHQLHFVAPMRWLTVPGRTLGDAFGAAIGLFLHGAGAPAPAAPRNRRPA